MESVTFKSKYSIGDKVKVFYSPYVNSLVNFTICGIEFMNFAPNDDYISDYFIYKGYLDNDENCPCYIRSENIISFQEEEKL